MKKSDFVRELRNETISLEGIRTLFDTIRSNVKTVYELIPWQTVEKIIMLQVMAYADKRGPIQPDTQAEYERLQREYEAVMAPAVPLLNETERLIRLHEQYIVPEDSGDYDLIFYNIARHRSDYDESLRRLYKAFSQTGVEPKTFASFDHELRSHYGAFASLTVARGEHSRREFHADFAWADTSNRDRQRLPIASLKLRQEHYDGLLRVLDWQQEFFEDLFAAVS